MQESYAKDKDSLGRERKQVTEIGREGCRERERERERNLVSFPYKERKYYLQPYLVEERET